MTRATTLFAYLAVAGCGVPPPSDPWNQPTGDARYVWNQAGVFPSDAREPLIRLPRVVFRMGHSAAITSVALSDDGELALTGSKDGTARLWRAQEGDLLTVFGGRGPVHAVAFTADGVWTGHDESFAFWTLDGLGFAENEALLAVSNEVWRWTSQGASQTGSAQGPYPLGPRGASLKRAGGMFRVGRTWGERLLLIGTASSVAFSPSEELLVTAGKSDSLTLWDLTEAHPGGRLVETDFRPTALAASPDGAVVAAGAWIAHDLLGTPQLDPSRPQHPELVVEGTNTSHRLRGALEGDPVPAALPAVWSAADVEVTLGASQDTLSMLGITLDLEGAGKRHARPVESTGGVYAAAETTTADAKLLGEDDIGPLLEAAARAPKDTNAHLFVVGIDTYDELDRVKFAAHTARTVKQAAQTTLGVPAENTHVLLAGKGTRATTAPTRTRMNNRLKKTLRAAFRRHALLLLRRPRGQHARSAEPAAPSRRREGLS